ncbi:MAG: redoxin domain-containing protein [Rubricoccaceae bacterium]|nr:redoxin domain-containing protein [Rubricoccaceae bacterium]
MLRPLLLALFVLTVPAVAQPLQVGQPLPEPSLSLTDARGGDVVIGELAGTNGLVVVFWSNVCPWTERYAERLVALARDYVPAGIGFVAVNANDSTRFPDEDVATMRLTADRAAFSFPSVVDDGGRLADALGARTTPQVFFFDSSMILRYEGAIDSSPADLSRIDDPYLQDAMDLILAGREVEIQATNALGCTIKRSD